MQTIDIAYDIVYNGNKIKYKYKNANTMGEVHIPIKATGYK